MFLRENLTIKTEPANLSSLLPHERNPKCLRSISYKRPGSSVRVSSFFKSVPRRTAIVKSQTPEKIVEQAVSCDLVQNKQKNLTKKLLKAELKLVMQQLPFCSSKPYVPKTDYFYLTHENCFTKIPTDC